ncbi:MAG: hypothetical protein IPQ07_10840 [Myxococcales bacterium]|nr:hypothetical protein [Myxococcales bacterium]
MRSGGWLGRDSTGTICWALPADPAYTTYAGLLTLPELTTLGTSAALTAQQTTTPMPPTSGSNYASGCPTVTGGTSKTVTLVAQ